MNFTQADINEMDKTLESMLLSISLFENLKLRLRYAGRTGDTHEWWVWNDNISRGQRPKTPHAYLFPEKYIKTSLHISTIKVTMQGSFAARFNSQTGCRNYIRANGYEGFLEAVPKVYDALIKSESNRRMIR